VKAPRPKPSAGRQREFTFGQRPAASKSPRTQADPEQAAKVAVARRARPSPLPDHVRFTLMLDLPRALAERLSARAIREGNNLEALVLEALKASLERG
jgi:hypothetical protein